MSLTLTFTGWPRCTTSVTSVTRPSFRSCEICTNPSHLPRTPSSDTKQPNFIIDATFPLYILFGTGFSSSIGRLFGGPLPDGRSLECDDSRLFSRDRRRSLDRFIRRSLDRSRERPRERPLSRERLRCRRISRDESSLDRFSSYFRSDDRDLPRLRSRDSFRDRDRFLRPSGGRDLERNL